MKQQVDRICQTTYFEIRRIGSIRQFTTEATKILVTSLVLARLDYCNSTRKQSSACDELFCSSCLQGLQARTCPSPPLVDLHWLLVECRIEYKIATVCYNVITGTAPPSLSDLLELYIPSCVLRCSGDTRIFRIPNRNKRFQGQRAFSFVGPSIWNNLPFSVRHAQTLSALKS